MAVKVRVPGPLRRLTSGESVVEVDGVTVSEALDSLGEKYREVFVLRDMQHLSIEETARALRISTASVKTRLLRARLMLRDLLAPGLGSNLNSKLSFAKGTKPW